MDEFWIRFGMLLSLPSLGASAGEIYSLGVVSHVLAAIVLVFAFVRIFLVFIVCRLVVS